MPRKAEYPPNIVEKIRCHTQVFNKLLELGGIPEVKNCVECGNKVNLNTRVHGQRKKESAGITFVWRCTHHGCSAMKSVYNNTFFNLFHTSAPTILNIIECWAVRDNIKSVTDHYEIKNETVSRQTVGNVFRGLRNICSYFVGNSFEKLGGQGFVVEIDETLAARIKYNRGSGLKRKQVWMFGLLCRKTKRCWLEIVPNRTTETLSRIIYDRVEQGSSVNSDSWSSYNKIKDLRFTHK